MSDMLSRIITASADAGDEGMVGAAIGGFTLGIIVIAYKVIELHGSAFISFVSGVLA